jgi:prepilin-type N-terminal cleavage/methylation domain-containing protein
MRFSTHSSILRRAAFTLTELIVVIAIIVIIAGFVTSSLISASKQSKKLSKGAESYSKRVDRAAAFKDPEGTDKRKKPTPQSQK